MSFTSFLICASVLLVQSAYSGCIGAGFAGPYGFEYAGCGYNNFAGPVYDGLAIPFGKGCGVASTGGGLPVASVSPIPPVGLSVLSENVYEGGLVVGGNLPFLGTIGLEGILPTAGKGAVSYGCGAGLCGIAAEEGPIATGMAPYAGIFPEIGYSGIFGPEPFASRCGGLGLGYGYDGFGCGLAGKGFDVHGFGYGAVY